MRVLFIYPNLNAQIGFNYGISYISGILKAHGIATGLLNVNDQTGYPLDLERIKGDVLRFNPDFIGFSVLTTQYKYALQIAGTYQDLFPWTYHIRRHPSHHGPARGTRRESRRLHLHR